MPKKNVMVTRSVDFQLDTDASGANDGRTLDGYAAVFEQPTRIRNWEGDFEETIAPGAFKKTLSERKPIMQYNHGHDARIGTAPIGTFEKITEDNHGLHVVGRLFDHPDVDRVRQGIESGDINGMSFAFTVIRDEWTDKTGRQITDKRELQRLLYDGKGSLKRNIKELAMSEAGPVLNPAYGGTSVGVRSADDVDEAEREQILETYCRTAGLDEDDKPGQIPELLRQSFEFGKKLEQWLDAENTCRWLEAENTHLWLAAERHHQAVEIARLIQDGFTPASVEEFSRTNDRTVLQHTGLSSVTLLPPKTSETEAAIQRTSEANGDAAKSTSLTSDPTKTPARKRMSTINEMHERIAAIEVRMDSLGTQYREASMPEAEEREFTEITEERSELLKTIEKVQARLDLLKGIAKAEPKQSETGKSPAFHSKTAVRDLEEIRNNVSGRNQYAHEVRENTMRFIDSDEFKPAGPRSMHEASQERIEDLLELPGRDNYGYTIGERILVTSSDVYERAFFKAARANGLGMLDNEERDALQLGSDANGGYAIPVQLDPTIIWTNNGVINPLRQLAEHVQIVGKEYQFVTSSGTTVQRHGEGLETDAADFTLGEGSVRTQRVDGFTAFTFENELGWRAQRSAIAKALSDAKDLEEANAFLLGDGTGTTNPLANGLLGTLAGGNTVTTVSAGALASPDLFAMENALDSRYQANAVWLGHKSVYSLARQWDTAGGALLWARIGDGLPDTLLDYPIYKSSAMAKTITPAAKVLILGDFSNFLIVDRIGMNAEIVPHIFGTNGRPTGKRGIFAWWMNNSKIKVDAAFKVLVGHS